MWNFQIDGRTKWWNRSAQEKKKETMKERIKRQDLYNGNTNLSQNIEFISKDMDIYD
jgi:hypothetical protein